MSRHEAEIALAGLTRRRFLVRAGGGAGAVALGGGLFAGPPARSATAVTSPNPTRGPTWRRSPGGSQPSAVAVGSSA